MHTNWTLLTLGLSAAVCAGTALRAEPPSDVGSRRPNVLLLMTDEHSPHSLGCYGNEIVKTPALDALAKRGVLFTAAYCQDPICVPSRASLVTGRMGSNVGVFGNDGGLRPEVPTMADAFKAAGYLTAWLGKSHWGGDPRFELTFDAEIRAAMKERTGRQRTKSEVSRLPEDARVADWPKSEEYESIIKEQAVRFLQEYRERPFLLGVSLPKPHFPFAVQPEYYNLYKDTVDLPRVTPEMLAGLPRSSQLEREKYGHAKLTNDQIRKVRAMYYGMVTFVDELFGEILAELDRLGLRENTVILYTSDHGELAGEHGLWYKNSFYEASAGIPFIWSFPKRLPEGRRVAAPVMNMDIFPTLCELCGVAPPSGLEGSSLVPLMLGREDGKDRIALSENYRNGVPARMIRTDRWKYCYFHGDIEQLFDMENDPAEEKNLIAEPQYRELAATLKARALDGWNPEDFFNRKKAKAKDAGKAKTEEKRKQKKTGREPL